jgi:hypothetical protein
MPSNLILAVVVLFTPAISLASDRVFQIRAIEDPNMQLDPAACNAAPFRATMRMGTRLWTHRTRTTDGEVTNERVHQVGTAVVCARLTNLAFPEGLAQEFYVTFELPDGRFTGLGTCTVISNSMPRAGIVLTGCSLKLVGFPQCVSGGIAASTFLLNPFRVPGFVSGGFWTLNVYSTPPNGGPQGRVAAGEPAAMQLMDTGWDNDDVAETRLIVRK